MDNRQYVGIDLHRRRSVIVRMDDTGEVVSTARITNDPLELATQVAKAGPGAPVALEATNGWYWAADVVAQAGATPHLVHPLGIKGMTNRRVKNDVRDATDLADLLRMGRLPEGWIAPPQVRELRELVRHRHKLVRLRSGLKAQVHAVLAKEGVTVAVSDLFGRAGTAAMADLDLAPAYRTRVDSLQELIAAFDTHVEAFDTRIAQALADHAGHRAVQAIPGVGPVLGAVFVAEVGDVARFASARHLCSWVGLTPRHRESDTTVHRGHITKQGSRLLRWAAIEAAQHALGAEVLAAPFHRIAASHGHTKHARRIARVAVARRIVTLAYYGLRDGHIRCLETGGS
jgi:transposase